MRIWHRLLAAQLPLLLAVAGVATVSVTELRSLGESSRRILSDNYRSVVAAQRMIEAVERLDSAALAAVAGRRGALNDADDHLATFVSELATARNNVTEPDEIASVQRLATLWGNFASALSRLRRADQASVERIYFDEVDSTFVAVKGSAAELLDLNQGAMVRKSEQARELADQTVIILLVSSILALVVGAVTSALLTARILRPLKALSVAAGRIASDDFEARADPIGSDEIAEVAVEFNRMAESLARFRRSSLSHIDRASAIAQASVNCIPDPVLVVATDGKLLIANPAGQIALGTRSQALADEIARVRDLVVHDEQPYVAGRFEDAVAVQIEGTERWFLCRGEPLRGEERLPSGVVIVLTDVTRLRQLGQQQEDGVAAVAHELRTPLTSLHMAIHLCAEGTPGPVTEQQAQLLAAAKEDCERVRATIDAILDIARLRDDAGLLNLTSIRPLDLANRALGALGNAHDQEGSRFRVIVEAGLPSVLVDPARSHIALTNLLTNAVRHSDPEEQITVRATRRGESVRIEVIDHGPGVPPEWRDRVFRRFTQMPGRAGGGAGLGLALACEVVLAHGGRIGVDETPGGGATFWIELPAA